MIGLLLAAGLEAAVAGQATAPKAPEGVEWIIEDGSNLLLRLTMEEGRKACGGILTVDPTRRTVRFEGIPGELGCRKVVDAPFADVKTLRTQRLEAGFVLEFAGKGPKLVLLPLPHFGWFEGQFKTRRGGDEVDQALATVGGASGADGDAMTFGGVLGGGGAGATLQRVELPKEVQADTQHAVDLIREAMGRQPAPAGMLREVLQGRPEDATVHELLHEPGAFTGTPVRVRARLAKAASGQGLRLQEEGASLDLVAEASAEALFGVAAAWVGQDVEVVGRLRRFAEGQGTPGAEYYLQAWECIGPDAAAALEGKVVTLPALLQNMGEYDGEVVRVVGRFRGRNLFGDLPARSQKSPHDWVIKSERAAVWVTGHKPGGDGWGLNVEAAGSMEWLEVVGRPRVRNGVAYLQAAKVALVPAPRGVRVVPPRRLLSSTPTDPPSVVFCLPLEGENVGPASRIVVQFDRNMDEESFKERVRVREEGGAAIGVRLLYDESRRSLVVTPVRSPAAGRRLLLELLPGIVDVDGVPLAPRPGRSGQGEVVEALRFGAEGD